MAARDGASPKNNQDARRQISPSEGRLYVVPETSPSPTTSPHEIAKLRPPRGGNGGGGEHHSSELKEPTRLPHIPPQRAIIGVLGDAAAVFKESLSFAYRADPGTTKARLLFSGLQAIQFLAYGELARRVFTTLRTSSSVTEPHVFLPVVGAFLLKGVLDALQGRSQLAEQIQQSKVETRVQERIRELSPKSLERLNHPDVNRDYKLVCWGGIWGLTGASAEIIKATGALASLSIAVGFVGWYASPAASALLAAAVLYPVWKTYQLAILQMDHEQEVAQRRSKATESSWSRVWPHTARLYRLLGIQTNMDEKAEVQRAEVVTLEQSLAKKKSLYNDIGHGVAALGGIATFLSLASKIHGGVISSEIAMFVGITMVPLFFTSLDSIGNALVTLVRGKPVLDAMRRLQKAREDECRSEGTGSIEWRSQEGGRISFKDVHFAYPTNREGARPVPILSGLSLDIEPGTKVAIVGDNGAGKSTLIQLLDRSYSATEGEISINGTRVADVTDTNLFRGLKCLPQNVQQIDGHTLREFLTLGRTAAGIAEDGALLERILNALQINKLLLKEVESIDGEPIKVFPHGLDTVMGPHHHGVQLSGGELSLLYSAYMLYSGASVIIFDEPEKAISEERQKLLFEALNTLDELLGYRPTLLLVTHTLARAITADKVLFVEKGTRGLSGYAPHEELLRSNPNYAEWYKRST
jgi:ABC-type multidrug transport system fused ATPase/permease subunit